MFQDTHILYSGHFYADFCFGLELLENVGLYIDFIFGLDFIRESWLIEITLAWIVPI
jgi:hypothetical protein